MQCSYLNIHVRVQVKDKDVALHGVVVAGVKMYMYRLLSTGGGGKVLPQTQHLPPLPPKKCFK